MAYKNDSLLVIVNKYGKASSDAKAELYETWDRLRDITDAGVSLGGSGLGPVASGILSFAKLFSPASFSPILGSSAMNVPGTSYFAPISGGTAIGAGGQASFGLGSLGRFSSYPNISGKAAPISMGIGVGSMLLNSVLGLGSSAGMGYSIGGGPTGFASAYGVPTGAGYTAGTAAASMAGAAAGAGFGRGYVVPAAGIIAGIGGMLTTLGPYFGPFGIAAMTGGAIANGVGGAVLGAYQTVANRILCNADTILTNKVKNIETTVKELDVQSGIIRKMIKENIDGDQKALQELL